MSNHSLSSGALARICQGEDVVNPVVQVLGNKAIQVYANLEFIFGSFFPVKG